MVFVVTGIFFVVFVVVDVLVLSTVISLDVVLVLGESSYCLLVLVR